MVSIKAIPAPREDFSISGARAGDGVYDTSFLLFAAPTEEFAVRSGRPSEGEHHASQERRKERDVSGIFITASFRLGTTDVLPTVPEASKSRFSFFAEPGTEKMRRPAVEPGQGEHPKFSEVAMAPIIAALREQSIFALLFFRRWNRRGPDPVPRIPCQREKKESRSLFAASRRKSIRLIPDSKRKRKDVSLPLAGCSRASSRRRSFPGGQGQRETAPPWTEERPFLSWFTD